MHCAELCVFGKFALNIAVSQSLTRYLMDPRHEL